MIVTELIEVSKSRSKVYIDYEFAFVLYKGELRIHGIKKGEVLTEETYLAIMTKVLPKRAKMRCLNLLKDRSYTEHQLRDKLRQGYYPQDCIDEAIAYVQSYHYIDDADYAKQFITYQIAHKSRRRIEDDLRKKGISKELIDQAYIDLMEAGIESDESILIMHWIEKKQYHRDSASEQETQKLYQFLYRKGFSVELIRKTITSFT
ncbi:MAG: regulatory protein RecX [Lachnospiraceae bacterium]